MKIKNLRRESCQLFYLVICELLSTFLVRVSERLADFDFQKVCYDTKVWHYTREPILSLVFVTRNPNNSYLVAGTFRPTSVAQPSVCLSSPDFGSWLPMGDLCPTPELSFLKANFWAISGCLFHEQHSNCLWFTMQWFYEKLSCWIWTPHIGLIAVSLGTFVESKFHPSLSKQQYIKNTYFCSI